MGDNPVVNASDSDLDPRRSFTRAEVRRVWERQGRICVLCERAIPFDLMHGDHIHPWSKGGSTSIDNCQALCGSCNLRKGSQPQSVVEQYFKADRLSAGTTNLRRWQEEAIGAAAPGARPLRPLVIREGGPSGREGNCGRDRVILMHVAASCRVGRRRPRRTSRLGPRAFTSGAIPIADRPSVRHDVYA